MKKRLDELLVEKNLIESRNKAQGIILSGLVYVNNQKIDKPGKRFSDDVEILVKSLPKFVSRGGLKLEHAIKNFKINVKDKICMDIGASTGGFTDCLLQFGAKKVYSIDVGYGQLHYSLRNNPKVINIERCNFRYIERDKIKDKIDICTIDVSFISLKLIIPKCIEFLKDRGSIIALIKPQFEAGKNEVEKGGIIKSPEKHKKILNNLKEFFINTRLKIEGLIESPILGQKGNKEFLIYLKIGAKSE